MGMIERKKAILLNEPHRVTVTGEFIHFETDIIAPLDIIGTGNITVAGKNVFDQDSFEWQMISSPIKYIPLFYGDGTYTMSTDFTENATRDVFFLPGNVASGASTANNGVSIAMPRTITAVNGYVTVASRKANARGIPSEFNWQIEIGNVVTAYEEYKGVTIHAGDSIKSFVGVNNIWSDNGNSITVTYWTH